MENDNEIKQYILRAICDIARKCYVKETIIIRNIKEIVK